MVALRGIASGSNAFGVIHPLVVLRVQDDRSLKVLQITPNLAPPLLMRTYNALINAQPSEIQVTDKARPTGGASQMQPEDGSSRPPQPEVSWENGSNVTRLAVEWQARSDKDWTDSQIDVLPNTALGDTTTTTAHFADSPGEYRWRVWSIGADGTLSLSGWLRLTIS